MQQTQGPCRIGQQCERSKPHLIPKDILNPGKMYPDNRAENVGSCAVQQFGRHRAAHFRAVFASGAVASSLQHLRAVGAQDFTAQPQRCRRPVPPNRRSGFRTTRPDAPETRALPPDAALLGASWIAASISAMRLSSTRRSIPMAPCATAGSISSTAIAVRFTLSMPKRFSPAIARNVASATPSPSFLQPCLHVPAEFDDVQIRALAK